MQNYINIAVVDDLPQDQKKLREMLLSYAAEGELSWKVDCFSSGEAFLESLVPGKYSLVFLDILMGGMDGIETAQRLKAADPLALLVFVTTEADYAVEGYEVEAAGFLIKEETQQKKRFDRLMDRLNRRLRTDPVLDFSAYGAPFAVPASGLLYAEVLNHNMTLHGTKGVHTARMTMEELKQLLPEDGRFFECHRGIVINLDSIAVLEGDVVTMEDGSTLPVSRRKRAELERVYAARSIARIRVGF